jgi:hypothetical protein
MASTKEKKVGQGTKSSYTKAMYTPGDDKVGMAHIWEGCAYDKMERAHILL